MMRLSVIIPILNEARQLPDLFAHLLPLRRGGHEIIFADGGSTDGSSALVEVAGLDAMCRSRACTLLI